jgi:hypothetical protein
VIATLVGAILSVCLGSLPVLGADEYFIALSAWALVGLLWLIGLVPSLTLEDIRPALVAPVVVAVIVVVIASGLPRVVPIAQNEPVDGVRPAARARRDQDDRLVQLRARVHRR